MRGVLIRARQWSLHHSHKLRENSNLVSLRLDRLSSFAQAFYPGLINHGSEARAIRPPCRLGSALGDGGESLVCAERNREAWSPRCKRNGAMGRLCGSSSWLLGTTGRESKAPDGASRLDLEDFLRLVASYAMPMFVLLFGVFAVIMRTGVSPGLGICICTAGEPSEFAARSRTSQDQRCHAASPIRINRSSE
jgi:hypothetical protein